MKAIAMKSITRQYKNNGQHAEQVFRFTLTGEICKADNLPHTAGGDCGDIQVKSSRATVCKGTDLTAYLAVDGAKFFAYVCEDFTTAFLMNREEYARFVQLFAYVTRESEKNGGREKLVLKKESRAMRAYLTTAIL